MAYKFVNQQKASAIVHTAGTADTYKIAGVNGEQTSAENFRMAMSDLMGLVGKANDVEAGLGRTISQNVETE